VRARPVGAGAVAVIAVALATARSASAQHHHGSPGAEAERPLRAGITAIAARFDTMLYSGDYQGLGMSVEWRRPQGGARIAMPLYRLQENGATHHGPGDLVIGGDVTALASPRWRTGVALATSMPTGDAQVSLGMGHAMLMPALWVAASGPRARCALSLGYSRTIGGHAGHDHGPRPLVEPMNAAELTGELRGEVEPWPVPVRATARVGGGVPVGVDGTTRAFGAVGASWHRPRFETGAEIQVGLAGDPFTVRGLVETAMRF